MSILICKNIETEGPGTIEDYLRTQKTPYRSVELSRGEVMPNPDNFDTLIIMGGPMSVDEVESYPYLKKEEELVRDFISKGKKILGICLGAQIMAKALGAKVYSGSEKEIGWYDIELTEKFKVFHWHSEAFDIPKDAVRLAQSELYQNQAFRYGKNAYAFQFHIEVTKDMIYEWLEDEPIDIYRMKNDTEKFYNVYHCRAINFYKAFLK
jgi:GMP synthase-like glutamine amidotransferase